MLHECHLRFLAKESISIKTTLIHHPPFFHPPSSIIYQASSIKYPPSSIIYPASSIISSLGCQVSSRNLSEDVAVEETEIQNFQEIHVMEFKNHLGLMETLPKAQRTRGLSSSFQSNLLGHITSSNTNVDHTSSSESQLSINKKS